MGPLSRTKGAWTRLTQPRIARNPSIQLTLKGDVSNHVSQSWVGQLDRSRWKTKHTHHAISSKAWALHPIIVHNHLEVVLPQPTIRTNTATMLKFRNLFMKLGLNTHMPLAAGMVPTKRLALGEAALAPAWGLHHSTVGERHGSHFTHCKCQNFTAPKTSGSTMLKGMFEEAKSKIRTLVCHHAQQCQLSRPWET